jgi:hypothetical protein
MHGYLLSRCSLRSCTFVSSATHADRQLTTTGTCTRAGGDVRGRLVMVVMMLLRMMMMILMAG